MRLTLSQIYYKIVEAYSSPWQDKECEIQKSFEILKKAIVTDQVPVETLITKAIQARDLEGNTRQKLYTLFINNYWIKEYLRQPKPIRIHRINVDQV